MAIVHHYLTYPLRRPGTDTDRYEYRRMRNAAPLGLPNGARLGVFIMVPVEWFPLDNSNHPFVAAGGFTRAYPDIHHYTARDYGNRVGIFRMMDAFAAHGVKPTAAMNAAIAERYPLLSDAICGEGWEIMASGVDMAQLHHTDLDVATERERVQKALSTLRKLTGQPIKGWHSPEHSESWVTPDLIAEEGVTYFADWANDELPYRFKVKNGSLIALPAPYELADRTILHQHFNSLADYEDQILAAFRMLLAESSPDRSRIFALSFTPWIMGQPHRIAGLERILKTVFSESGVVALSAGQLADAFNASQ